MAPCIGVAFLNGMFEVPEDVFPYILHLSFTGVTTTHPALLYHLSVNNTFLTII